MGTKPNVQLAKKAFMEIDEKNGGIAVNSELMVCSDVYAVSSFHTFSTEKHCT